MSSAVDRLEYDFDAETLTVRFTGHSKRPKTFIYQEVPEFIYREVVNSDSIGRALNELIKPTYEYAEVL